MTEKYLVCMNARYIYRCFGADVRGFSLIYFTIFTVSIDEFLLGRNFGTLRDAVCVKTSDTLADAMRKVCAI